MRFRRRTRELEPSKLGIRDLLGETSAGISQRPGRSVLTAIGTVLGVGTLVAILGLTTTASSQISSQFNALLNTQVTVNDVSSQSSTGSSDASTAFPADTDARTTRLHGVVAAGLWWSVNLSSTQIVRSSPLATSGGTGPSVVAASPGFLAAAGATLRQGRLLNTWDQQHRERVAVLGPAAAAQLGITTTATQPVVLIGDQPYVVVGILQNVTRMAQLLSDVVIPSSQALTAYGEPAQPAQLLIATQTGAAQQIAREIAVALRPDHPEYLVATAPPDPQSLRTGVTSDLNQLFLLLGGISLVIGAVGIANTSLVAVLERTSEIGLRRSLGALRRHISAQFLSEAAVLGSLGGLVGTSLGTLVVVGVSVSRSWTPVIDPKTLVLAPCGGLIIGLVAGIYPAWRASRIEPVEALRH